MVSIIIPTYWKRVQLAFKHAYVISKYNCFKNNDFEIIIIDSSEKDFINIENINNISYYNLDLKTQNSLCLKRNFGASKSNGKILIFLDDDVLPDINYFNFVMMNLGSNQVICGNIFFPIERVNELPLVRYKESRHRIVEQRYIKNGYLKFNNFVAMCFAITKNNFFEFDVNFNKYGFEDIDYGRQLENRKAKITLCLESKVFHYEETNSLFDYKKKLYSCSRYMFPYYNKKYNDLKIISIILLVLIGILAKLFNKIFLKITNYLLHKNIINSVYFFQIIVFAEGYLDYIIFDLLNKNPKKDNEFI